LWFEADGVNWVDKDKQNKYLKKTTKTLSAGTKVFAAV